MEFGRVELRAKCVQSVLLKNNAVQEGSQNSTVSDFQKVVKTRISSG